MVETRRRLIGAVGGAAGLMLAGPALAFGKDVILVRAHKGEQMGELSFAGETYTCMVGKSGIVSSKHEGDGGTPSGLFPMREVRFRPDRQSKPKTGLPCFPTLQDDGWCDDPADLAYNRLVRQPYPADFEAMWREDRLYDVVGIIGYNDAPVVPGAGSAIFLHVMRPPTDDHQYTAGCVSLELPNLLAVLAACTPATAIDIRTV